MTSMMRSVGVLSALLSSAAVTTAGSSLAPSIPNVDISRCGTAPPSDALREMAREMGAKEREQKFQARDAEPIVVPTVVHVVYANETEEGGYIPVCIQEKKKLAFRKFCC